MGLKGRVLQRKAEHDAEEVKMSMQKVQKAKYYVDNAEKPQLKPWQKLFFGDHPEDTNPERQKPMSKKSTESAETQEPPPARPTTRILKRKVPDPNEAQPCESKPDKVKIFVHTKELTETITVRCKLSSSIKELLSKVKQASSPPHVRIHVHASPWSKYVLAPKDGSRTYKLAHLAQNVQRKQIPTWGPCFCVLLETQVGI